MPTNSIVFFLAAAFLGTMPSSYAMQNDNKTTRLERTIESPSGNKDSKFELLRSLPVDLFEGALSDLLEQGQVCAGATCKDIYEKEERYRVQAKRNAIVVPAEKQYRNLTSFIKYLGKYKRIPLPVTPGAFLTSNTPPPITSLLTPSSTPSSAGPATSSMDAGDSKSVGNGSNSKIRNIGSLITQIDLGRLQPEPTPKSGSPQDASVGDVLKAIQTIFPEVQELHVANADLKESDLQIIGQMKNLRVLNLEGISFYHPGIRHLSNLTEMRRLNVSASGVKPPDFNPAAQFLHLSKMYHLTYLDFAQTPEIARAFQEWILAIRDNKNGFAAYRRALMLDYGTDDHKGPAVDSKLAIAEYEKAAQLGHPLAQTQLANYYEQGIGVKADNAQAYHWFKKAFRQGHAEAEIGYMGTRFSRFTEKELARRHASLLGRKEPTHGSPKEHFNYQVELGIMYLEGLGTARQADQARCWFLKAAEKGLAFAQDALAYTYCVDPGGSQDLARAVEWFRKAAEQGSAAAQRALGMMYQGGYGVAVDRTQAVKWFEKAAQQGDSRAQLLFGQLYCNGEGVDQDYTRAAQWFKKAAEQGQATGQYYLGELYANGHGVDRDPVRAVEWYRRAAEQGLVGGQFSLGDAYLNGRGVGQDYVLAAKWFQKAAEQGLPLAQNNLGTLYYYNHGVDQDFAEAFKWYQKAVDQRLAMAQSNLAILYERGHGVALDRNEAIRLYGLAIAQGDPVAQIRLNNLLNQ